MKIGFRVRCVLPLAIAISAMGFGQPLVTDVTLGSTKIGENVYETRADGTFSSRTEIKVAGTAITSVLTGRFQQGRLVEATLEESNGTEKGKLVWKDDKLSVFHNGKQVVAEQRAPVKTRAFFGNYHPQLWRTFFDAWRSNPNVAELTVTNLNSFQPLKFALKVSRVTATVASKPLPIVRMDTNVAGAELSIVFDSEGMPLGISVPAQSVKFVLKGYDGVFVDPLSLYPELSPPTYAVEVHPAGAHADARLRPTNGGHPDAKGRGQVPHDPHPHALWARRPSPAGGYLGQARLRRGRAGCARSRRQRRRVGPLRARGGGWESDAGLDRIAAVERWQGRHDRRQLSGQRAVGGGRERPSRS